MINPFKKRQQRKAAAAASGSFTSPTPTDYASFPSTSHLPPRPGIFISSAPAAPRSPRHARQQQAFAAAQQQSLDHVLPPASDYRQSLIMPHLTRRFTLLRAPDGSLVSPDAMRAHLRAQRARARAANVAIGSGMANDIHFLTEDEENEIIEQLKAQARAEGRDFDLEQPAKPAGIDSWYNGYSAGTDGFGSWGPTSGYSANKLSSLAESIAELSSNDHTSTSNHAASLPRSSSSKMGGSLFTGRSAERDQAHFRNAHKERNLSKSDDTTPPIKQSSAPEASEDSAPVPSSTDSQMRSQEAFGLPSSASPGPSMPGGFADEQGGRSSDSTTSTQRNQEQTNSESLLEIPGGEDASRSRTSQDSNLLTTLSPEAFKRVSTALDEVFGLIASERGASPAKKDAKPLAEPNHRAQRSSGDSDTYSFASALTHVRTADSVRAPSSTEREGARDDEDDDFADRTITASQPTLDAVHIEEGRLALPSPLPALPGSLPDYPNVAVPGSQPLTHSPALATSDSMQTVMDTSRDLRASQDDSAPQPFSTSGDFHAESILAGPSDRTSTATATEVPSHASRVISTASTQRTVDNPDRTPDINTNAFIRSPPRSSASRGDPIVSSGSVRSSLTGPSSSHQGTHSRKSSADQLALARSMAPHPHLREQPSLASVRRNYRQHVRSTTGSSEGSLLGSHASRRSSGALSPAPVLSRSARSPNYYPPPSSNTLMHDYASGFKPPSAISPAATAALQSMANHPNNNSPQPVQSSVMDASNALRSVQNMRNSASTGHSNVSPNMPGLATFASGSERAAATSSPDTGSTRFSVDQRNAPMAHSKQLAQKRDSRLSAAEDGFFPSMYAPRPAPVVPSQPTPGYPDQPTVNETGLMPHPPSDPDQADRWRAVYNIQAADAVSLRASAEDVSAESPEDEDLWARMASASDPTKSERPVSNFPPSAAEERLAGSGITFDQIADFQDRLIQTANGGEAVAPLPRIQPGDYLQQQKFVEAKSKGLASPNLVFGAGSEWTQPQVQPGNGLVPAGPNGMSINTNHNAPPLTSASGSIPQDPPVSPRAVMYDVTTSHRPTSPPLHSRNGSLNGLPSLLELNGSIGQRNRESFSLSQAVEQASRSPYRPTFGSSSIAEDPNVTTSTDTQYAFASQVQEHPFNVGYSSPPAVTAERQSGNGFTFPRPSGQTDIGQSPRQGQTQLPEDVWERYGPQQGGNSFDMFNNTSPGSQMDYLGSDPTRLMDDVAAQTSAATRALKGADNGTTPTPPFRTKSISRKKSFKKVSKQISSPQLISTTQKLDHANQILPSVETPSQPAKVSKRTNRSPGWGSIGSMGMNGNRSHSRASPSTASQGGGLNKSSAYHRRRSSSFGNEASPSDSFGLPGAGMDSATVSSGQQDEERPGTHPNHPYMHGGANGGSLSRLFSKMKSRKNVDQVYGGATIEPFPPQLSGSKTAAPASQQTPSTPELPSLPAIERSTPWTLSKASSVPSPSSSDRASSLRSPKSPIYTLPIDSTSMPRNKSKKKRTPIVLKRESEVIMPGDPGHIPTAIIGRSPEQRARELAEETSLDAELKRTRDTDESRMPAAAPPLDVAGLASQGPSAQSTGQKPSERMDYLGGRDPGGLVPIAALIHEASPEAKAASSGPGESTQLEGGDETLDGPDNTLVAAEQEPARKSADARKSLRDTIVRRTIIIPAGIDFGDQRRSLHASSRKSRRFAAADDEPVPSSANTTASFLPDSPAAADSSVVEEKPDHEHPMSTLSSQQTLHPDASAADGSRSNRISRVESSYAGSLYDMYIGENVDTGSPDFEQQESSSARPSVGPGTLAASRASRMPETRRHIEVTERADGSVVWQVIAGLADRGSVYSDFDPRQSRYLSDASGSAAGANFQRDSVTGEMLDETEQETLSNHQLPFRTPAGLTDDDSRSFFTRPGGAPPPPLAELPRLNGGVRQDVFEIANPPASGADNVDSLSPEHGVEGKAASPTRIVYHNDAQLASLLDVLAKGKDSAKFEFQIGPPVGSEGGGNAANAGLDSVGGIAGLSQEGLFPTYQTDGRPLSTWTKQDVVDADDIESHRSRVEAEIYTLLNQQALLSRMG